MCGSYKNNKVSIYNYRKRNLDKCREIVKLYKRQYDAKKKYFNVDIVCKEHLRLLRNLY